MKSQAQFLKALQATAWYLVVVDLWKKPILFKRYYKQTKAISCLARVTNKGLF